MIDLDFFQNKVFSVSEFNNLFKSIIDEVDIFKNITITGELKNFKKHVTGNYFFQLIDKNSSISCVVYSFLDFNYNNKFKDGDKVKITGSLTIFNKKGTYNIVVKRMSFENEGEILLNKNLLIKKLQKEGVISDEKRNLPKFPRNIGLLCGENSAAYYDIVNNINNRYKNCIIYFFPCIVQGNSAKRSILQALEKANNYNLDILIISRGGGEDLSVFDDEDIAIKIHSIKCPTIAAIGHDVDYTVCDYVSDVRVSTPTAAALTSVPNTHDLLLNLEDSYSIILNNIKFKLSTYENNLKLLNNIIENNSFSSKINKFSNNLKILKINLSNSLNKKIVEYKNKISLFDTTLDNISPYNILKKGYVLVYNNENKAVSTFKEAKDYNDFKIKFVDGVIKVKRNGDN